MFDLVTIVATGETVTASQQVINALTSGFTSAAQSMVDGVVAIIPIALPVLTGFLTIGFGIRLFKKLTGTNK